MMKRQIKIFLIVGILTVLIDYIVYRGLVWSLPVHVDMAKAISFIVGTIFAYFANRSWTFQHQSPIKSSAIRFMMLYGLTLSINVGTNALCLMVFEPFNYKLVLAFLIATGLSALLNFIGMKFFVFKHDLQGVPL